MADSMILLGSVPRSKLEQLLHEHIWLLHLDRQRAVQGLGAAALSVSDNEEMTSLRSSAA